MINEKMVPFFKSTGADSRRKFRERPCLPHVDELEYVLVDAAAHERERNAPQSCPAVGDRTVAQQ
jgi:hypothetical protein